MKCGQENSNPFKGHFQSFVILTAAFFSVPCSAQNSSVKNLDLDLVPTSTIEALVSNLNTGATGLTPVSVSLNDIILSAYSHHPQLRAFRADLQGTKEILNEAKASYLPQLALTGGANISDRFAELQNGNTFDQNTQPKSLALRMNHTLYTGGRRKLLQQGAVFSVKSAQARYESLSTSIAAEIISDYLALLSAEREYEILNQSVGNLVKLEEAVTARKNAGDATRTDVAQAVSRLASARAQRTAAQAELALARDRLLSKTGFLVESPFLPAQAKEPLSLPYEEVVELARQRNPNLAASRFDEKSALVSLQSERRKYLPTVTLQAAATTVRDSSPTIARDDDLSIGVNFTMPLYSGGSGSAQTRRALASYNSARYSTENVQRESDLRINQLWSRLQSGKAVLAAQRSNVAANAEALEGITRGEEVGLASIQDILDSEENKLQAELALHRAQYQQYTAFLLLRLYTGELDVYDFE